MQGFVKHTFSVNVNSHMLMHGDTMTNISAIGPKVLINSRRYTLVHGFASLTL